MKQLSYNVAKVRSEKKLTVQELAEASGVGIRSIDRLEGNCQKNPTMRVLSRLANALGVHIEDLYSWE